MLADEASSSRSLPPAPTTVLVVDDDAATRMLTSRWLTKSGMHVEEAVDGFKALEAAFANPGGISVIVLDVMMPGLDGYEVLSRLQANPETASIPVVLLTAHANADTDVVRGIEGGAVDHLAKPFKGPVLVARIQALIAKRQAEHQLRARLEKAEKQATTDPLTGLANRRDFDRALAREAAYCQRHRRPLSLVILDIDHFKSINDLFGHPEGDRVLQLVSSAIRDSLRREDAAYRVGGEEFAVLLRDSDHDSAIRCVQRLQSDLKAQPICFTTGDERVICFSAGVAAADDSNGYDTERFVERADDALYRAKRSGRDQVAGERG